uniref:Copia LTR rider n=1 Tax=Tanacetum cinerariifolium TaxID=118510 RepID=A0A699HW15_TANCI|nr:copia LTR rider [Tanacetum cinerariifolium]
MGYNDEVKGYQIWSPSETRVIFSQDVTFDEDYLFRVKQDLIESKLEGGFKTHLVTKGYSQKEGINYNKIFFSLVIRYTSIRVLLSLVAHYDWELEQLDVKIAYVYGDLENKFKCANPKALLFKEKNTTFAHSGSLIYLLLYVDDMLEAAKDMEEVNKLKILLNIEFDMKDLGGTRMILDYATDLDAKRSLTDHVFTIRNLVKSWKATLQPLVTLSTTQAKYMALTEVAMEGIWLKVLIEDLGFP